MEIYNNYLKNNNLESLVTDILRLDENSKTEALNFLENVIQCRK